MAKKYCYRKLIYKPMYYAVYSLGHKDHVEFLSGKRKRAIERAEKLAERKGVAVLIATTSGSVVKC